MVATAIEEALKGNYQQAIELNRQILKENPDDIEALNRLAFALTEKGLTSQAKKIYNKVLSLNKFNPIAIKNLKRLQLVKSSKKKEGDHEVKEQANRSILFLEEVGKTKVVTLIHLAEAKLLSNLHPTNTVNLIPRRRGVAATTNSGEYIGALPDDIARRLYTLMKGGNIY